MMRIEQVHWTIRAGWDPSPPGKQGAAAQLVLLFGSNTSLRNEERMREIRAAYPRALVFGCSTAGEISGTGVDDDSLAVTAVEFEHSSVEVESLPIRCAEESYETGRQLASALEKKNLLHALVLSEGVHINGTALVRGLASALPPGVALTGGLAADGDRFSETSVLVNGAPETGAISLLGFYGNRLKVGWGSLGGWDPFGPERRITRSKGNVLFELDGTSALDLYKRYLGEHAKGLPATALLFPLSLRTASDTVLVRTILSVNEEEQSMTFAGDVPEGAYARLMKANFDRLIDGAAGAARTTLGQIGASKLPSIALLISCVGRKMILKQRIEEEVEGVHDVLGDSAVLAGFYSYGEISPMAPSPTCELHNQTMSITMFSEE